MDEHMMDERKELDPKYCRKLKRVVRRHHTNVRAHIKARQGLGKRRYR